jgi:hypothetical protein
VEVTKRTSGQTLVEFALLLPLLLVLVMALFDIGRAILYYSVLNTAAREGTRFAIVQPDNGLYVNGNYEDTVTCSEAKSAGNIATCNLISNRLFNISELSNSIIEIQHKSLKINNENDKIEYYVIINIFYDFEPITPGLGLIGKFPIQVNSQMLKTLLANP